MSLVYMIRAKGAQAWWEVPQAKALAVEESGEYDVRRFREVNSEEAAEYMANNLPKGQTSYKRKGCPICFGSGGKRANPCLVCGGTGKILEET